jgi:hypothetical protein
MNDHQCVLKAALVVQVGPPPPSVANLLNSATVEATAGFQMFDRRITPLQNEPVPRHICDA